MRKIKPGSSEPVQAGFDFDSEFTQTIETIERIQTAAVSDADITSYERPKYVDQKPTAAGNRGQDSQTGNLDVRAESAVPSAGLEDTRPLGDEHSREAEGAGNGRGSSPAGALAGTTEAGTRPADGLIGDAPSGDIGGRNSATERGGDRAVVSAGNYVITDSDRLGEGGAKSKYRDNIAALRLVKQLQEDGRQASKEEQAILVRYVGWGGIPQAFDHRNSDWKKEFAELSALLPKEDYEAARRSTQDAHYTAKPVVEAIHAGIYRLGFRGGRMLESALGSGNFIGLLPPEFRDTTQTTGIELDPLTAAIAQYLYPDIKVINKGFQEVTIPSGHFDVAAGNPPFGNQSLYDPNHKEFSKLSIHNFFIAKSLDKVRDGGVGAFVVSSFFMDAKDSTSREMIAERAHLLGAIRLPNTAFKQNALTEVTTDIVFLKKKMAHEVTDKEWVNTGTVLDAETGGEITLNQYFVSRPDMMLGTMALSGTMYRGGQAALIAAPGQNIAEDLDRAISKLPEGVYRQSESAAVEMESKPEIIIPKNTKVGSYFVADNGRVAMRLPDLMDRQDYEWVESKNDKAIERVKGMIAVRTVLRDLMSAEQSEYSSEHELDQLREQLNKTYDEFVKRHGHISAMVNRQAMRDDPEYPLLHALERDYDKGITKDTAKKHGVESREPYANKAAIFSKRVIAPSRQITSVETGKEALVVSMNETGRIDLALMVRLTGREEPELVRELDGLIYLDPKTQQWEIADKYLTGNVKGKLNEAIVAANTDPRFASNMDALKLVQPADIEPVDIAIQLGSTWVPEKAVNDFVTHLIGNVHRNITYQPALGKWVAKIGAGEKTTMEVTWGTAELPANRILETILGHKAVQVKDVVGETEHGKPIYKINEDKTAAANQKADEIRTAFNDWVWEDKERRENLSKIYNERFNTNIPPKYDGSHLQLPGASTGITPRPHQNDAIWRGIQDGGALFDHTVGAGKTIVCIGTAMESKRMGLFKKPMFVVPNHLLLQWKDSFYQLYPNANILVAEKTDFTKENRQKLFAKIVTGDWDAVIVAHSSFKKIGMPEETLSEILNEQIDDLTDAVVALKEASGDRVSIKEMEKARDRMKAKLEKASETGSKDAAVSFADLGVDALFVDEAHEFKNLFITTSLTRVAGLGNLAGSDKAFDLFVKARYLQKKHDGRGLYFATGTPISNTIAELYTVQRYMQYDELKARGIVHFDAWASTFGQVVSGWELDATGVNYKLNSRFSKFQNVPELVALYRSFADVITKADLDRQAAERGQRFPVPKIKGGKPLNIIVERSGLQENYMGFQRKVLDGSGQPTLKTDGTFFQEWNKDSIIYRMENLPDDPRIDNPLKITNDARKAGLDFRLIDPDAPDVESSKVNRVVEEVYRIWKASESRRGTQLVFCDLSTPKKQTQTQTIVHETLDADDAKDQAEEQEAEVVSMDELLASSGKFSVYDDIKQKLIARGIPESEVRFIHEAKTDIQKQKLFDQINLGEARVTLGSTPKMGAGMNAQRKLVALHHIDAPWRPSDLEQREGRILRQGNEFYEENPDFEVEIIRYSTRQTYDSRMWQTIEYKASGIEQFRKGDSLQRVIEDVAGEAANAAEMKAAATGNPLIFLQVQLSSELKKMEALHSNYRRNQHSLASRVEWLSKAEERTDSAVELLKKEIAIRDANTRDPWVFEANGKVYGEKDKEGLLADVMGSMKTAIEKQAKLVIHEKIVVPVGRYRGFDVGVYARSGAIQFLVAGNRTYAPDNLVYGQSDQFSLTGFIQRLDNVANRFEYDIRLEHERRDRDVVELVKARAEAEKPFANAQQLEDVRKDYGQVMVELKKMQNDSDYVSTWKSASRGGDAAQAEVPVVTLTADHAQEAALEVVAVDNDTDMVQLYEHAEGVARQHGFKPRPVNRNNGIYVGSVVAMTDRFLIQDVGMRLAVVHQRDGADMQQLKVGDNIDFRYSAGKVAVRDRSKQQEQDVSR